MDSLNNNDKHEDRTAASAANNGFEIPQLLKLDGLHKDHLNGGSFSHLRKSISDWSLPSQLGERTPAPNETDKINVNFDGYFNPMN